MADTLKIEFDKSKLPEGMTEQQLCEVVLSAISAKISEFETDTRSMATEKAVLDALQMVWPEVPEEDDEEGFMGTGMSEADYYLRYWTVMSEYRSRAPV